MKPTRVRHMVLSSLFAALMSICAWTSIPVTEIAFTLQTFGVLLTLGVLGGKWGSISILTYLLLGSAGLPVFSGFRGGLGVLLGPTGGYLLGFLACGLSYWLVTAAFGTRPSVRLAAMVLGLLTCYSFGTGWFLLFYGQKGSFGTVIALCVAPYLLPDLGKLALAHILTRRLRPQMKL